MSYASDRIYARLVSTVTLLTLPVVLVVCAFSGCNVRKRSDKAACNQGAAESCLALGRYYENKTGGLIGYAMSNGATATHYYDLGCKHGSDVSCERLGHLMFNRFDSIKDSDVTYETAVHALAKACVANVDRACDELHATFTDSLEGPMAQDLALRDVLDACNKRNRAAGCYEFALFMTTDHPGAPTDLALAKKYFAKACAGGDEAGCARAK